MQQAWGHCWHKHRLVWAHSGTQPTAPAHSNPIPSPREQDVHISSMGRRKTNARGVLKGSFLKKHGPKHRNTSFEGQYLLYVKQGKVLTAPET